MSRSTEARIAIDSGLADVGGELDAIHAEMASAHDEWAQWMSEEAEALDRYERECAERYGRECAERGEHWDTNPYDWDERVPF